jgi:hypothetical protein
MPIPDQTEAANHLGCDSLEHGGRTGGGEGQEAENGVGYDTHLSVYQPKLTGTLSFCLSKTRLSQASATRAATRVAMSSGVCAEVVVFKSWPLLPLSPLWL